VALFDSPFLLGFDQFERAIDRASRASSEGYPPYNIEQIGDIHLRITVAVAGFTMSDLSVHIEHNQLVIRGRRQNEDDTGRVFLHRGIATRQFQRAFILSEDIEVVGAVIDNGLLNIDLKRNIPETTIQVIPIRAAGGEKKRLEKETGEKKIETITVAHGTLD
jgi:HSP20 family molecular chaperone IbpA